MKLFPDIDREDTADIRSLQGELLSDTVEYLRERSPHYSRLLSGVKKIRSIDDIEALPVTRKEDIQKDNASFLCAPMDRISEVVATTGTTGTHVYVYLTQRDLIRLAENEKRSFGYCGVTTADLFVLSVTMDNLFIAGLAYYAGLHRLGAGVVRLGPQSPKKQLDVIRSLKPTGIVTVPAFLNSIYAQAEKDGVDLHTLCVRKAVLIGDAIRNPDFTSNALGNIVQRVDSIECYSTYGITEAAVGFCECGHHTGFHSHPDLVYPEILDESGRALPDGQTGELAVTTFQVEGMPLLRYRTGDITYRLTERCRCGRASARIGPIVGRCAQKLKVKGTTVYPKAIENALLEVRGVENYVIEAYTGDDSADHVVVRVGSHNRDASFKKDVCEAIRSRARFTPQVLIEGPQEVEKILFEGGRRKPLIFIDRRTGTHDVKL